MNTPSESINLFNFPLNITIVDDDIDYLNLLQQQLKNTQLSAYSSPIEAMTNIATININMKDFLEEKFIGIQDLNYKNIEDFVKNCKNEQGILIVDYDMPEINGIELCSKYNNHSLIKILLTNAYTIEDAVNALNEKLINYYLPKERISILLDVIKKQQNMFFDNITRDIINFLDPSSLSFLFDKVYINIFNSVCQQYNVNKYYILNSYGNYYLENTTDKFIFSIYNSIDLLEIAQEIPKYRKHDVEQGNLIPSYFSDEDTEYKLINAKKQGDYSYCIEHIF